MDAFRLMSLPQELRNLVAENIIDQASLASFSQTCRWAKSCTQTRLYEAPVLQGAAAVALFERTTSEDRSRHFAAAVQALTFSLGRYKKPSKPCSELRDFGNLSTITYEGQFPMRDDVRDDVYIDTPRPEMLFDSVSVQTLPGLLLQKRVIQTRGGLATEAPLIRVCMLAWHQIDGF